MDRLLDMVVWEGKTLREFLTFDFIAGIVGDILGAILILIIGWILAGFVRRRIVRLSERYPQLDRTLFGFLANIIWYAIIGYAVLFVLSTFGIQTASVVAVIGAAGLAIGLALQGTLSNVAAGVMIVLFRPIKLGDFVEVNDRMGTVESITLNFTELTTTGNVQVIVPNSEVWGNTIVNYSANDLRRAEWTFGVSYGADLKRTEEVILQTIMADERSLSDPEPFIQVNNLGDYSVDFLVRVWVPSLEYFTYQADMKRQVKEALDAAGIEIPFPTRTVLSLGD